MPKRERTGLRVVSRPGTSTLYLAGTVRGQRIRESTGTDRPDLAEEARAQREQEIFRAAVFGERPKVTFAAATVSYLEAAPRPASTRAYLHKILRHIGPATACRDIGQGTIDTAARAILRPGASPATRLRQIITPIRAVLTNAAIRGWCDVPRFERIEAPPARTGWLTPAEAEKLIGAAPEHARPLFVFLFGTGARLGEALALDWRDVELADRRCWLRDTKNGRDRLVALPARVADALAALPWRDGPVFRHARGAYRRTQDSRTVPYGGQVRRAWAAALDGAAIGRDVTPHNARHTWATWHYCVHRDLLLLRTEGGWQSASQVERYAHLAPPSMAAKVRLFWDGNSGTRLTQAARRKERKAI